MRIKRGPRPILLFLFCFGSTFFFYPLFTSFPLFLGLLFLCLICFASCNSLAADPAGTSRPYKQLRPRTILAAGISAAVSFSPAQLQLQVQVQITHTITPRQVSGTGHTAHCTLHYAQSRPEATPSSCRAMDRRGVIRIFWLTLGCSALQLPLLPYSTNTVLCPASAAACGRDVFFFCPCLTFVLSRNS